MYSANDHLREAEKEKKKSKEIHIEPFVQKRFDKAMLPARKEMVHTTRVLSNSPLQNDSPKSFKKRGFHKYQTLLTCLFLREVMPKAARVLASTNPRMKCQHSSGSSKDTSILGLAGRRKEKGLATSWSASPSLPTCVWKQTWKATQWIS